MAYVEKSVILNSVLRLHNVMVFAVKYCCHCFTPTIGDCQKFMSCTLFAQIVEDCKENNNGHALSKSLL